MTMVTPQPAGGAHGQATCGMAKPRRERTGLPSADERILERRIFVDLQVLVDHREGAIDGTEDVLDLLRPI